MGAKFLEVIELKGIPREIGRQYGEACSEKIREHVTYWVSLIKSAYPQIDKKKMISVTRKFLKPIKEYAPDLVDEMRGISEGAKVSFEDILFINIAAEPFQYFPKLGGCTSFAATGEATKNGETIIGQTVDWGLGADAILQRVEPAKGPKSLGFSYPGLFQMLGINSAGIGGQGNLITSTGSGIGFPPFPGLYQKVLQQEKIADCIKIIGSSRRASAANFLVASSERDIVDIEVTQDDMGVLYPQRGFIAHSNHFLTDRFKSTDLTLQIFPDSYLRVNRLTTLMEKHHGELSINVMKKLLADHNDYPDSICRHVDKADPPEQHMLTVAAVISCPKEQKMYISNGNPCENEFMEYKL